MSRRSNAKTFAEARREAQARALGRYAVNHPPTRPELPPVNLEPSDARLEPFYADARAALAQFVLRAITRDELRATVKEIAQRHGVTPFVPWQDFP